VVAEDFTDKGVETGEAGRDERCACVGGQLGEVRGSEFCSDGGEDGRGFDEVEEGEVGYWDGVEV
jgi:hypothetical protein